MKEPFLVNPPKHVRKHGKTLRRFAYQSHSRKPRPTSVDGGAFNNPVGEMLITVGGNPMRYFHHYRRHNPVATGLKGVMDVQSWAPLALTGGLAAASVAALPPMFGIMNEWVNYGAKLAIAFGGGLAVGNFVSKDHGQVFAIVGTSLVMYDVLKKYVLAPFFPQLGLSGVGAYGDYTLRTDSQMVSAFPSQVSGADAYPDHGGVQAFPLGDGMGSYPYDGAYGSYDMHSFR